MKVLLVSANTEMINMPVLPLGMSCVAKPAEDSGHDVSQINLMAKIDALSGLIKIIKRHEPEVGSEFIRIRLYRIMRGRSE